MAAGADPVLLPENPPDVGVFFTLRLNEDWLPILIGAVEDALGYPYRFADDDGILNYVPEEYHQLLDQLQTPVLCAGGTMGIYHAWNWISDTITLQKGFSSAAHDGCYCYTSVITSGQTMRQPCVLPAGSYVIRIAHWVGTIGGYVGWSLVDADGYVVNPLNFDTYNATPSYNNIASASFTLTEDFDGIMEIGITTSPSDGAAAKTLTIQTTTIERYVDDLP